jgi:hypothetical protein
MEQNDVEYYINGINFKTYGIYVSASSGVTSKLAVKDPLTVDYDDYNGVVYANTPKRYKERTITLECFIEASGENDFFKKANDFISNFERNGSQRFQITVGNYILPYEIVCNNAFDIYKKWDPDYMVGDFSLNLIEPEPVKKVLKFVGSGTASITVTSVKMLNIYWGDGTHNFDISGGTVTKTHDYTDSNDHIIIITGNIEDITDFSTNCIVIWNKLQ